MSSTAPAPVPPGTCPICGTGNACGLVAGAPTCWCFTTTIPAEALARVPEASRGASCICQACAAGGVSPAAAPVDGDARRS